MDPIQKELGPLVGKSLRYMVMDSWEAGMQNWTDDMIAQFTQRRDMTRGRSAGAGRARRRQRGSERSLPLGLSPHDR